MTKEKIMAFLNLKKDSRIDKSFSKGLIWFDVGVTLAVIIIIILVYSVEITIFNIICLFAFIIADIVFLFWYFSLKIPTQTYKYASIVMLTTILKLIYGFAVITIKTEEKFSFLHIITFFISGLISYINISRRRNYLKDLEIMSIKATEKKWAKKDKGIGTFILPISTTAVLAIILSRILSNTLFNKIGLGFVFWVLAFSWSILAILFIQNWMLVNKYKIVDIFKNNTNTGDSSVSCQKIEF